MSINQRRKGPTVSIVSVIKNLKFLKNNLDLSNGIINYRKKEMIFKLNKTAKLDINGNLTFNDTAINGMKKMSSLRMDKKATLSVSGKFRFFYGADIVLFEGSKLLLGRESYINSYCKIRCKNSISIGNECAIGPEFTCIDSDWHSINNSMRNEPIVIGNHVWIGARVTVLSGVHIR